jgi:hypothetical protein
MPSPDPYDGRDPDAMSEHDGATAYVPMDQETIQQLADDTRGVLDNTIDVPAVIHRIEHMKTRLGICPAESPFGEAHNVPMVPASMRAADQVEVLHGLVVLDNLQKIQRGGFQPGVLYAGTSSPLVTVIKQDGRYQIANRDTTQALEFAVDKVACIIDGTKHTRARDNVVRQVVAQEMSLPKLRGISNVPLWSARPDGTLHVVDGIGYDINTGMFVATDITVKPNRKPIPKVVDAALKVIYDVLDEFPFADESSRTHAIALALTLTLRNLMTTAPGFVVTALDPDSGKTLLVEVCWLLVHGGEPPVSNKMAYNEGEQERRNIGAVLRDTQDSPIVWFDEPRRSDRLAAFVSPTLNNALTSAAGEYRDRLVYSRETTLLRVTKTFILSGNNLVLGREMERRVLRINLEKRGQEFSRTEDELRAFARDNQAAWHQAVATLIGNWHSRRRPAPPKPFNSYNAWNGIVGGILEAAGVAGLRDNEQQGFTSDPLEDAKARFLLFLHDDVYTDKVTELPTVKEMTVSSAADRVAHDATLRDTLIHLAESVKTAASSTNDRRAFTRVFKALLDRKPPSEVRDALGNALATCATFNTLVTGDGELVRIKRLARTPIRYRLTTDRTTPMELSPGRRPTRR